jgi:hypothetical protein
MPATYSHTYSVTSCPDCGAKLTNLYSVDIETTDGVRLLYWPSRLDSDGVLVDVDGVIASGQHSDTMCRNCGLSLADYETFED